MRRLVFGTLIGTGLVFAALVGRGSSESTHEQPVHTSFSGGLITHVHAAEGGSQAVTVIDPRTRVMGVYHVDRVSGEITLKSVRNITWDLQMVAFNSGKPLPQDIRSGLPR